MESELIPLKFIYHHAKLENFGVLEVPVSNVACLNQLDYSKISQNG
jgi:hypothetical protein